MLKLKIDIRLLTKIHRKAQIIGLNNMGVLKRKEKNIDLDIQ